jgi:predicted Rdx family selenoprotein
MKFIRRLLTNLALLPVSGCIFPVSRDGADIWDHAKSQDEREHPAGLPRAEQPQPKKALALHS